MPPALIKLAAVILLLKVLFPPMVCAFGVIKPLLAMDASGKLNVCVLPADKILTSVPVVPIAKSCASPKFNTSPFSVTLLFTSFILAMVLS